MRCALICAYALTKDVNDLRIPSEALDLFEMGASDGGIRNMLFGHVWFEEYSNYSGQSCSAGID